MQRTENGSHLSRLRHLFAKLDVKPSKSLQRAYDDYDKLAAVGDAYRPATTEEREAAIVAALTEGRDPAADPEVQRIVTSTALVSQEGGLLVGRYAEAPIVAALTEAADDIVSQVKPRADAAGADLTAAAEMLDGTAPDGELAAVVAQGVAGAQKWAALQNARGLLNDVGGLWAALAEVCRFPNRQHTPALRFTPADPAVVDSRGVKRQANPWAIVVAGGVIDLADRAEYVHRCAQIEKARTEDQAEVEARAYAGPEVFKLRGLR